MTISILGCGWYGQALALHLLQKGYVVKGSATGEDKLAKLQEKGIRPYLVDLRNGNVDTDLFDCDALIIACGADIGDLDQYCLKHQVKRSVFISSTGVYGLGEVDELSATDTTKPHYLAERKLDALPGLTVIRFSGLVGPGRMPGRFLAGKKDLANGSSPVNLIHLTDCIGLTEAVIDRTDIKIINGVSPDHPTRKVFYQLASEVEGLTPPEFGGVGGEQKLVSTRYPELYRYQITDWLLWLAQMV